MPFGRLHTALEYNEIRKRGLMIGLTGKNAETGKTEKVYLTVNDFDAQYKKYKGYKLSRALYHYVSACPDGVEGGLIVQRVPLFRLSGTVISYVRARISD